MTLDLKTRRQVTLADLMILVAVVALGAATLRTTLRLLPFGWFPRGRRTPLGYTERYVDFLLAHGLPLFLLASLAVVALTLRRWARLPRRMGRRPGFIFCAAAVVSAVVTTAWIGAYHARLGDDVAIMVKNLVVFSIPASAGHAVIGAWLAMGIAGRGRPMRSPLDSAGYALGVFWVLLFAFCCARFYLDV
jgi:hypothetical protein